MRDISGALFTTRFISSVFFSKHEYCIHREEVAVLWRCKDLFTGNLIDVNSDATVAIYVFV